MKLNPHHLCWFIVPSVLWLVMWKDSHFWWYARYDMWGMNTLCETFKGIFVTCAPNLKHFKWQTSDFYARCQTEQNFTYQTFIIYRISVDIKITSTVIRSQLLYVEEGKGIRSNDFWQSHITYSLCVISSLARGTPRKTCNRENPHHAPGWLMANP